MAVKVDLWNYREAMDDIDLSDFRVEAADGEIGKVSEATYSTGGCWIVVDAGPWILGKNRTGSVGRTSNVSRHVSVGAGSTRLRSGSISLVDRCS